MRVLQINSVAGYGSTGRIVEEIGEKIRETGGESYIVYGRKTGREEVNDIRVGGDWECRKHWLLTRIADRHGLGSARATRELVTTIRKLRPNVIHLHNLHGYYLNIRILFEYLIRCGIPVVWTLHDCWAVTGHCAHFAYCGCWKWLEQCSGCQQKNTYPASWFTDRSAKNYKLKKELFTGVPKMILVPVSDWLGNIVHQSFLRKYPVEVIHNGIDLEVFKPVEENVREKYGIGNRFMILGVANDWDERKGWNDFQRLYKCINSEKYCIVMVGVTAAQKRKLPPGIIAVGRTANVKELAGFYSAADVFVNLTWEDTFPTTNLEAMACGTPVITYRTGGSVEAVTEETGCVVDQGDLNSLKEILYRLYMRGVGLYREKCRRRALELYAKSDCYEKYIQLYKKVIQKNV